MTVRSSPSSKHVPRKERRYHVKKREAVGGIKKNPILGDPQGSILGLLLFLMYVHDIDTNIRNDKGIKLTLFADGTSILVTGKHTHDLIFNLDRIGGNILPWFDKNRLIINKGRSLALCFHPKSSKHMIFPDIILKDKQVTYISEVKFLGV